MSASAHSLLIVDDEELNREGLARRLQRHGYAVTVAQNGREAIELLGGRRFDLVLLDIMMPGMNGLEVLKFLRRVDSLIDLPIIMVTAKGESEDMVEALELGANDYVTKPLDFPVVLARIRTQLGLRQAVAQVTELEKKLDGRNKELEAAAAELAAANEHMRQDLEAAARVQQAFLPVLPPEIPGVRFAWIVKPSGHLAGEVLNVYRLGARHLGLSLLDVNGQGVASALLSVAVSQLLDLLSSPAQEPGRSGPGSVGPAVVAPAAVVGQLSKRLSQEALAGQPFALLYGVLNLDAGEFRFVSAGQPGPIHMPQGSPPILLEVTGFPVGVGKGGYTEQAVTLRPGDRLVLYSDGVTQARNADGEHFGSRRLLSGLEQTQHATLEGGLDSLLRQVEEWCADAPRHDDIALLAVEMAGPETPAPAPPVGPA